MSITDLPYNINTGNPYYELEDPLVRLQTNMNNENIDVESLDERGTSNDVMFRGREPAELQLITGYIEFGSTTGEKFLATRTQVGVAASEDTWSVLRGYPQTVTFHEGRLWFGGSTSRARRGATCRRPTPGPCRTM